MLVPRLGLVGVQLGRQVDRALEAARAPLAEQVLPYVEALADKFGSTLILVRAYLPTEQLSALIEPSIAGAHWIRLR